jgi:hypothetical protein
MSSRRLASSSILWMAVACLFVTTGCGTSEYNRLASARFATLRGDAKFRSLFGPTKLPDTPVSIRVPQIFKNSYVENSSHKVDGATIHPDRLQPPFLQLPGFKICYEGTGFAAEVGQVPYYCYLAALPGKPGDGEAIAAELQAKLKEVFKDTPEEWTGVDAESPTGTAVQWKKLRVVGNQKFRVGVTRSVQDREVAGIFELWICEKSGWVIIVGWRTPSSAEGPAAAPAAPTDTLAEALKGGGSGPAIGAKIDMGSMPALTAGTVTVDGGEADPAQAGG